MKTLKEKKREKENMDALLTKIADYMNFMDPAEELQEEELEFVTAAASEHPYVQFLKKMEKK